MPRPPAASDLICVGGLWASFCTASLLAIFLSAITMARSNSNSYLLITLVIFAFCLANNGVSAFGAGNIPSYAPITLMKVDGTLIFLDQVLLH